MHADFDRFFRENFPAVVGALTLAIGSREAAEDAAQHGFLQALRRWRRIRSTDNPIGWVYVVALNSARKAHRHDQLFRLDNTEAEPTDGVMERAIDRELLSDAVGELTSRQRTVFVLRHVIGLRAVDVAAALDLRPGTVRALDHQARTRLRTALAGLGELGELEEALDAN